MKVDLSPALAAARNRLRPALALLREHRFWMESTLIVSLAIVAGFVVGTAAQARAAALGEETTRLMEVRAAMDRWVSGVQRPAAAESAAWRESEALLGSLRDEAVTPLSVSHLLARRAEEVGIRNIGIRLTARDSAKVRAPVSVGRWAVEPGEAAVVAEFTGDWSTVIGFLGVLPPQVEVVDLKVTGVDGSIRARFLLVTRQVVRQE